MFLTDGTDTGYKENQNWWNDPADPHRYRYADLDLDYPRQYFPLADPGNAREFVQAVSDYYMTLVGTKLQSVVEFGSGGGWYLKAFQDRGIAIHGYEGSAFGVACCMEKGVTGFNVDVADFRLPMERKFKLAGIAICTEVAEHVEPPFHGTFVHNLIKHSHLIWFSSEPPNTNRPHLHHPGEQPLEYWKALFNFFGYGCHMIPDEIHQATNERGRCIFFNKKVFNL